MTTYPFPRRWFFWPDQRHGRQLIIGTPQRRVLRAGTFRKTASEGGGE